MPSIVNRLWQTSCVRTRLPVTTSYVSVILLSSGYLVIVQQPLFLVFLLHILSQYRRHDACSVVFRVSASSLRISKLAIAPPVSQTMVIMSDYYFRTSHLLWNLILANKSSTAFCSVDQMAP